MKPNEEPLDPTLYAPDLVTAAAALEAILDAEHDHADELLRTLKPAALRNLALAAQDLAHMARAASLRPYLQPDEIAALGTDGR